MRIREAFNLFNILITYSTQDEIKEWDVAEVSHFDFLMWIRNTLRLWPLGDDQLVSEIIRLPDFETYLGQYRLPHENPLVTHDGVSVNWGVNHPDNLAHVLLRLYHAYLNKRFLPPND